MVMISRLYRRIYKYMALSVLMAVVLTFAILQSFFHFTHQHRQRHFVNDQVDVVLYVLNQTEPDLSAEGLKKRIQRMSSELGLPMRYVTDSPALRQRVGPSGFVYAVNDGIIHVEAMISRGDFSKGALEITLPEDSLRKKGPPEKIFSSHKPPHASTHPRPAFRWHLPPHLFIPLALLLGMLLLLALFLWPLVNQIMRPIRILTDALTQVSQGNFAPLEKLDHEFQPVADTFNHMATEVESMLNEKQRLIADVSHELRSPLARMQMNMALLEKEGKGNPKYINGSLQQIEELDHLINDLLDISALELHDDKLPLETFDAVNWVQQTLEEHRLLFAQKQIQIHTAFPAETITLSGRKHLLNRALNNILSNALKYAPEHSDFEVKLETTPQWVIFSFRDRGPGVPAEALDKLTEPFYRVDTSRTRKTGGTGLGLSIVQKILHLHKGQLVLSLPDDGGLCVEIRLPAGRAHPIAM